MELDIFDSNGDPVGGTITFPLDGNHTAAFLIPDEIIGEVTGVFCVTDPDSTTDAVKYDITAIRVNQKGESVQFDAPIFADGFESGDVSAWSSTVP